MRIAVVAPFEETVPPQKYGGTELVVSNLVEQLVKMGHDITLLAAGDSKTHAHLIPIFNQSLRSITKLQDLKMRESYKWIGIGKVASYLTKNSFDILHNHLQWRWMPFADLLKFPTITTLHSPLTINHHQEVYRTYQDKPYVSISLSQRRPLPELTYAANVYNGIDTDKFNFFAQPKDYFAFLGRMSPEKGPVQAIAIAKKAGVRLRMAAKVDASDEIFFKKEVKPLIDDDQIQFIGEVDHAGKVALLGNARGLLAPIQWEEPFGLFFVEAMACGTPVITMKRGSAPEVVRDKETGYLCQSEDEAVTAINEIDHINRRACYDHVQNNFSMVKMTEGYLAAYQQILTPLS